MTHKERYGEWWKQYRVGGETFAEWMQRAHADEWTNDAAQALAWASEALKAWHAANPDEPWNTVEWLHLLPSEDE